MQPGRLAAAALDGNDRRQSIFGNELCASAHPSDVAAALVALRATVRTTRRELPVAELYRLPTDEDRNVTSLATDELVLELDVPAPEASTYLKAMDRRKWAFPLVGVAAARFPDGIRIALAGVAPIPWALDSATALRDAPPRDGLQGRDRPGPRAASAGGSRRDSALGSRALIRREGRTRRRGVPDNGCRGELPVCSTRRSRTRSTCTNFGAFSFRLDVEDSPCTTASFAALVRKRFFDGTRFHRIVPGFVIQGGDPTATGTGGPGYSVVDVPPANALYTRGVVAMAKSGNEPPGTSGSQFFVVTGDDAGLPPEYAILGVITKGLRVVERIGRLGDANERPTRKVVVLRMTLTP